MRQRAASGLYQQRVDMPVVAALELYTGAISS
jgi:hypothetical protein